MSSIVSTEKTEVDEPSFSSTWYKRLIYFLRIAGACCGALTVALGFIALIVFPSINPRSVVNSIYEIIFGLLMLICEARLRAMLKYFAFLRHFLGLGFFYIFVGGLSLGGAWYQLAVGGVELGIGVIYCVLGLFNRQMYEDKAKVNQKLGGAGVTNTANATKGKDKQGKKLPDSAFTTDEINRGGIASTNSNGSDRFPSPLPENPIDIRDVELQTGKKGKKATLPSAPDPSPPPFTSHRSAYAGNNAAENPFES